MTRRAQDEAIGPVELVRSPLRTEPRRVDDMFMTRPGQVPLSDLRTSFGGDHGLWSALVDAMSTPPTAGPRPIGLDDTDRPPSRSQAATDDVLLLAR